MKFPAALLLAVLLAAFPAGAASQLDALRSGARTVREQVGALRADQLSHRNELSQLSSRIETLKAQAKGKLLPNGELDVALKQSQELSTSLTSLAQQLSAKETELEAAQLALLGALSAEWTRLRGDFDRQTDRAARRGLIDQMKRVRGERDALRATLPAAKLPSLDTLKPSDDPEEMLEQADLLRDNEEKLRRELQTLEKRINERKDEVELDKRVQRFLGEESMFDDQDRRLRVQRTETLKSAAPTTNGPPPQGAGGAFGLGTDRNSAMPPTTTAGSFNTTGPTALGAQSGFAPATRDSASFEGTDTTGNLSVTRGSDARPQVGTTRPIATGDDDDVNDLEIQRLKLKSLADDLKKKAIELEKKAATLR